MMELCTYVSEEGDEESAGSEALSLLSCTLKYISPADVDILCQVGCAITDAPVYMRERGGGGRTHTREVAGANGKQRACSALGTAAAGGPESPEGVSEGRMEMTTVIVCRKRHKMHPV